ncbi:trypsin-like serine peptidase [Palleronia sediminis]|nr:trypsin-like serine protease [Palleronia sediminis]
MRVIAKLLALALFMGLLAGQSIAGESGLRALVSGDDSRPFRAVGRLDFGDGKFCTATLIAPRAVLTAAHCVHRRDGTLHDATDAVFRAGWRDGRAEAYRTGRRIVVAEGYAYGDSGLSILARDVALVELDLPVDPALIPPVGLGGGIGAGAEVGVVSYAHDRAGRPSLQETCHVIERRGTALLMSCEADFGTSGAPVLQPGGDGTLRVVSVVSAMANADGQRISIGTDLRAPVAEMLDSFAASDGVFHRALPGIRRLSSSDARAEGPGKFLKP